MDGIERPDWGDGRVPVVPEKPAEHESNAVMTPEEKQAVLDEAHAKANGQEYQPASDLDPALLQTWDKQGGSEQRLAIAQNAATAILENSPDPQGLQTSFDALPQSIQTAVFDHLSVSIAKGQGTAAIKTMVESLTPQDRAKFEQWVDDLDEADWLSIRTYFNA